MGAEEPSARDQGPEERQDPAGTRLTWFAFLWAVFGVVQLAKWASWSRSPVHMALALTAWWLLFRPGSIRLLVALLVLQVVETAVLLPWVSNHTLFTAILALTLLVALAASLDWRTGRVDRSRAFETFAPAARVQVLGLYFWAFFHKLNTDWLDPATSCGATLYAIWSDGSGVLPTGSAVTAGAIYLPLLIEGAIPLLLVARRTRWVGLLLAASFHYVLGIGGFYRFAGAMFAALFVFTPDDIVTRWRAWVEADEGRMRLAEGFRGFVRGPLFMWGTRAFLAIAIVVLLANANLTWVRPDFTLLRPLYAWPRPFLSYEFQAAWAVFATFLLLALIQVRR